MTQKIKMTTQPIVGPLRHQVVTIFWMEKHVPKLSWKVWRSTDFLFTSKKTCRKFWHEFGVPMKRPKKRVDFLILCQFPLDFNSTKYHQFHEIHHTWSHISASSFDQFLWSWIMAYHGHHQNHSSWNLKGFPKIHQGFRTAKDEVGDSFLATKLLKNSPVSFRMPSAWDENRHVAAKILTKSRFLSW